MDPRQDWTPVTIKSAPKKKVTEASSYVDQATAAARRAERETESFKVTTIDAAVAREVREGRARTGMTQKQLAQAVNEKPDVIKAWEAGTAPPNGALLVKLRRALK